MAVEAGKEHRIEGGDSGDGAEPGQFPSADSQLNRHATVAVAVAACDTKSQARKGENRIGGGSGQPDKRSAYVKCLAKHMDIEWPVAGPQLYSSLVNVCCG